MTWKKPTTGYWDNKFTSYMHDPFDKALKIKGHVDRAAELIQQYGLEMPNNDFWKKADGIASGFERGQITGYKPDESTSGSVDFLKKPLISHPIGEKNHLEIDLQGIEAEKVWEELKGFIISKIGIKPGDGGYSDNFKGNPGDFALARFFYTHLALRFYLAHQDIGKLGALWHRLPADTRFPDHSIWQHNALVSAIQSCFELAGNDNDLGMMVFSITPVQGFIANARKLRDYWTGSVLLSWLAFEGIRWVIENLGPDHILYPSLIDQPLINEYLKKEWKVDEGVNFLNNNPRIASFPNKFLFLIPFKDELVSEISQEIEKHILDEWQKLNKLIIKELPETFKNNETIKNIFKRQNKNYWDIQWAAVKLLEKDDKSLVGSLLSKKNFENQFNLLDIFLEMIKGKEYYEKSGKGVLYSVSHSMCQAALAAQKTQKEIKRMPEPGEKCQMCGEFEVLHDKAYEGNISANDYKKSIDEFWKNLRNGINGNESGVDFDKDGNEKLCSVCFTKRIAYRALKNNKGHILNHAFMDDNKAKNFPSTTYMSLYNFFKRNNIIDENKKRKKAQEIHEDEYAKVNNRDKYYAILLMDGDLMGKLVNGETVTSTWGSIMHPDMVGKIKHDKLDGDYNKLWQKIYDSEKLSKRLLTPSIHAAISESLGDFALYGVASIVKKYEGRLIYAGGDDVCAVLPIDNVLKAAKEIQKYYGSAFRIIKKSGETANDSQIISEPIKDNQKWKTEPGKLSVNLGKSDRITISAGILLCHHKESLSEMIKRTHRLLDEKAKGEGGRNAVAIELRKRSGGSRYFVSKWNDERLNKFEDLIDQKRVGEELSRSLAYRFEEFKDGIGAILEKTDKERLLADFVMSQLKRSGNNKTIDEPDMLSEDISRIIIDNNGLFSNEGLIIAGFLTNPDKKQ